MDFNEEEGEEQAEPQVVEVSTIDAAFVDLQDGRERQAYAILKNRVFSNTKDFDSALLEKTGIYSEFASVWHALGWEEFVPVQELGSWPLTIQFLCSLRDEANDIKFRFFGTEYHASWKDLNRILSFSSRYVLSLNKA